MIDESTGIGAAQPDAELPDPRCARRGFLAAGLAVYVFWNLGTLIGALTGSALGQPETLGLDAAFPAAFVVLLAPHLRTAPGRLAAVVAGVIALVTIPFVPTGVPILLAGLGAVPAAWLRSQQPDADARDRDPEIGAMTWWALLALAAGAYAFKAFGVFGLARVMTGPLEHLSRCCPPRCSPD